MIRQVAQRRPVSSGVSSTGVLHIGHTSKSSSSWLIAIFLFPLFESSKRAASEQFASEALRAPKFAGHGGRIALFGVDGVIHLTHLGIRKFSAQNIKGSA